MNEVEKLYSLAGVEPDYDYFTLFDDKVHKIGRTMHLCKEELKHWLENYQKDYVAIKVIRVDKDYPPFTAEKQLELIKWLSHKAHNGLLINNHITDGGASMVFDDFGYESTLASSFISFEECLANLINNRWQDLTEEEKQQIKEILK